VHAQERLLVVKRSPNGQDLIQNAHAADPGEAVSNHVTLQAARDITPTLSQLLERNAIPIR
jgi:hypothetical protein